MRPRFAAARASAYHAGIEAIATAGVDAWLDEQFARPVTRHSPIVEDLVRRRDAGEFAAYELDIEYLIMFRRLSWWHATVAAEDTLRQRVAFALSEIFVVSDNVDEIFINPLGLSNYYDTLLAYGFGNFRDLLRAVTLHPVMGIYLSHVNNAKTNPVTHTFPDENYAREVMQLFSIGLYELNNDGSRKLVGGNPIPTYDNGDIGEFAKIFTGLSYGPAQAGGTAFFGNPNPVLHTPMQMFEAFHEPGTKHLLNNVDVPAGQSGMQDIDSAIDNLFNHPNVGPFFGRLLIQRLVTSNPSPQYVARVATAFNGNGGTPRGDMIAVLRAVLLDPEAKSGIKLREPFLRYVALNRILHAHSTDTTFPAYGYTCAILVQQNVSRRVVSISIRRYSPPGELGGDLGEPRVAPEFQITTTRRSSACRI